MNLLSCSVGGHALKFGSFRIQLKVSGKNAFLLPQGTWVSVAVLRLSHTSFSFYFLFIFLRDPNGFA